MLLLAGVVLSGPSFFVGADAIAIGRLRRNVPGVLVSNPDNGAEFFAVASHCPQGQPRPVVLVTLRLAETALRGSARGTGGATVKPAEVA
jgi:hypothetical protein